MNKPATAYAIFLAMTASVWADEIKVTTYYPAPWGEYQELRSKKAVMGTPTAANPINPADTLTVYGNTQLNSIINLGSPKPPAGSPEGYYLRGQPLTAGGGGQVQNGISPVNYPAGGSVNFSTPFRGGRPVLVLEAYQVMEESDLTLDSEGAVEIDPDVPLPVAVVFGNDEAIRFTVTRITSTGFAFSGVTGAAASNFYWSAIGD